MLRLFARGFKAISYIYNHKTNMDRTKLEKVVQLTLLEEWINTSVSAEMPILHSIMDKFL